MPARNVHVAWRLPAKRGPRTPLVVFLHGRGADERDLIDCASALPREYAYASVRGSIALDEGGYTWFESRAVARPIGASLRASVGAFRVWLDGPQTAAFDRARTYLVGFSAGMMMAGALVLEDPARFAGAALLSGALALDVSPSEPERLTGLPIFHGHGEQDLVIPGPLVDATTSYLRERSGAVLTERSYPHAHAISARELGDIAEWFGTLG